MTGSISDHETAANFRNSVLARRDDLTGFVKWVKSNPELDETAKKFVSALAAEYSRERSR